MSDFWGTIGYVGIYLSGFYPGFAVILCDCSTVVGAIAGKESCFDGGEICTSLRIFVAISLLVILD